MQRTLQILQRFILDLQSHVSSPEKLKKNFNLKLQKYIFFFIANLLFIEFLVEFTTVTTGIPGLTAPTTVTPPITPGQPRTVTVTVETPVGTLVTTTVTIGVPGLPEPTIDLPQVTPGQTGTVTATVEIPVGTW